jgi:hypothetical protein
MVQLKFGLVAAACLGLILAGTATSPYDLVGPALADKGGNGNGGGHGGGNGNAGGGNKGNSGKGHSGDHGKSSGHAKAASAHDKTKVQHDKSKVQKNSVAVVDDVIVNDDDNTLGPLNAAHASARARERAAPNSSVGKIATYERNREAALAIADPVLRDQALDDAVTQLESDFDRPLTDDQVDQVNALLDARR